MEKLLVAIYRERFDTHSCMIYSNDGSERSFSRGLFWELLLARLPHGMIFRLLKKYTRV